jgi:hypothetical protein
MHSAISWIYEGACKLSAAPDPSKPVVNFIAYDGDFGDEPNDGNFYLDGLVSPSGESMPGLLEVKGVYVSVRVEAVDIGHGVICVSIVLILRICLIRSLNWSVETKASKLVKAYIQAISLSITKAQISPCLFLMAMRT